MLQEDIDRLKTRLEGELDDLGSDYYKFDRFDPRQAGEMFAGLLAMNEIENRQKGGEKLEPDDLRNRFEELKKDPVVVRTAEILPGDPKFRICLEECREKKAVYGPTVTTALTKAYESYSRGKLVSESSRSSGIISGSSPEGSRRTKISRRSSPQSWQRS